MKDILWLVICLPLISIATGVGLWYGGHWDEPAEPPQAEVRCYRAVTYFDTGAGVTSEVAHPWCFSAPYFSGGDLAGSLYGILPDGSWGVVQEAGELYGPPVAYD